MRPTLTKAEIKAIVKLCTDISATAPEFFNKVVTVERLEKSVPYIMRAVSNMVYFQKKAELLEDVQSSVLLHMKLRHKGVFDDNMERTFCSYLAIKNDEINLSAENATS